MTNNQTLLEITCVPCETRISDICLACIFHFSRFTWSSLFLVLFDVRQGIIHGGDFFSVFIGDFDAKFFFQSHH